MTSALEGGEGSASRPGRFTPGEDAVPTVQETGWTPGPVWTGAENLALPGFDPRTVQPVASRYTDYATRPNRGKGKGKDTRKSKGSFHLKTRQEGPEGGGVNYILFL